MSEHAFRYPRGATVAEIADQMDQRNYISDPELFALFAKIEYDNTELTNAQVAHYRRMMAVHYLLIANRQDQPTHRQQYYYNIERFVEPEIRRFRSFRDLSKLSPAWDKAVTETLELYGDPDSESH